MKRNRGWSNDGNDDNETEHKQQRVSSLLDGIVPGDSTGFTSSQQTTDTLIEGTSECDSGKAFEHTQLGEEVLSDAQLLEGIEGVPTVDVLNTTQYNVEKLLQAFPRTIAVEKKTDSRRIASQSERQIVDIAPIDVALQTQLYGRYTKLSFPPLPLH